IKAENQELVTLFKNSASGGSSAGGLYFTGYTIDSHGNIRIAYIGEVNVLGYTEKEAREKLEVELGKFLKNPETVFVTVKLGGINFIVTGEVGSPGTKNLMQNQVSIVDALANSGEISTYGDRENVVIIRKSLDGVKKYKININEIAVFESENFYIQPNDIIYVAPLKQKSWGIGTTGLQAFTTVVSVLSFIVTSVLLVKNI
ncbi:MAG: polysaccharide biosynthesis/export family protein, partial [Lutibacter sp.]